MTPKLSSSFALGAGFFTVSALFTATLAGMTAMNGELILCAVNTALALATVITGYFVYQRHREITEANAHSAVYESILIEDKLEALNTSNAYTAIVMAEAR